jgi:UDP-glucose 4-epimerase
MASRGSVIPLFVEQIKSGNPLTITDPDMTRFMMSLPDAGELVLFAFEHGKQGDTFVQKAPAATVLTLAKALKKILNADNEIRIIGTRHGEKKHEALLSKEEHLTADDMGDYFRVASDTRDLNYTRFFEEGDQDLTREHPYTSENTEQLDVDGMVELLMELEYMRKVLKQPYGRRKEDRSKQKDRPNKEDQ